MCPCELLITPPLGRVRRACAPHNAYFCVTAMYFALVYCHLQPHKFLPKNMRLWYAYVHIYISARFTFDYLPLQTGGCFAFCKFGIQHLQVQIPEISVRIWMCKFVKCIFRWYAWSLFLPESSSPQQTAGRRDLRDSQRVEIHAKLQMFSKMMVKTGIWLFGANRK